jgi:excisionase family DNA binding protein
MKAVYTTGEVADICKISQQTVIRCFDEGRLRGFRVPGSRFRRIPRDALISFMKANQIPLDRLDADKHRVLIVDDDRAIVEMLTDLLRSDGRFEVKSAANGYDAGLLTVQFRPDVILLDYLLPDLNGNVVCQRIRANPELSDTKIIIVSGAVRQEEIDQLRAAGADEFIRKPFDVGRIIAAISTMLKLQ